MVLSRFPHLAGHITDTASLEIVTSDSVSIDHATVELFMHYVYTGQFDEAQVLTVVKTRTISSESKLLVYLNGAL